MKTYTVLFAEDVPHYGTVEIEAPSDDVAIAMAKERDLDDVATEPEWCNAGCRRIVSIDRADGRTVAHDIRLDNCFLRYGGEEEERLCDTAPKLLTALVRAEYIIDRHAVEMAHLRGEGEEVDDALTAIQAAIDEAKGKLPQ